MRALGLITILCLANCASGLIPTHVVKCYEKCYSYQDEAGCESLCISYDKDVLPEKHITTPEENPPNEEKEKPETEKLAVRKK